MAIGTIRGTDSIIQKFVLEQIWSGRQLKKLSNGKNLCESIASNKFRPGSFEEYFF